MRDADAPIFSDSPLRSVFDVVDGRRIHGRIGGSTSPATLVFVHGMGVSTRYMEPTMARLASRHAVAALDLPGFGRSEPPARPQSLADHADVLDRWLAARGIARAILVGNSYGCQVIVEHVVTVDGAREVARLVGLERPGASGGAFQSVASAAHALPFDQPDTFAAVIANFADHGARAPSARG